MDSDPQTKALAAILEQPDDRRCRRTPSAGRSSCPRWSPTSDPARRNASPISSARSTTTTPAPLPARLPNFFAWCGANGLDELAAIEPIHVGAYIKSMAGKFEKPTVKQHLATIRMLFDILSSGKFAPSTRRTRCAGRSTRSNAARRRCCRRRKRASCSTASMTSTVVGLRDRALIALMTFSFARVGAAVGMRVEDYFADGKRWRLRLNEKGGKVHEMPAHHNLEAYLDATCMRPACSARKGRPCSAPPIGMAAR